MTGNSTSLDRPYWVWLKLDRNPYFSWVGRRDWRVRINPLIGASTRFDWMAVNPRHSAPAVLDSEFDPSRPDGQDGFRSRRPRRRHLPQSQPPRLPGPPSGSRSLDLHRVRLIWGFCFDHRRSPRRCSLSPTAPSCLTSSSSSKPATSRISLWWAPFPHRFSFLKIWQWDVSSSLIFYFSLSLGRLKFSSLGLLLYYEVVWNFCSFPCFFPLRDYEGFGF